MRYYCNECNKTITMEEFQYSMNKYRKALCKEHQRLQRIRGPTKDLQDLVRRRHKDELTKEVPKLVSIKDWIHADFDTWDKVLKQEGDGTYVVTISKEESKHRCSRGIKDKNTSKDENAESM